VGDYRPQRLQRQLSIQRVLLAVYWLADADGLYCAATNAEIAQAAGRGVQKTQEILGELLRGGHLGWSPQGNGIRRRVFVLMDHPDAEAAMAGEITSGPRVASVCV
jgi:hypothetical protein